VAALLFKIVSTWKETQYQNREAQKMERINKTLEKRLQAETNSPKH